MNQDGSGRRKKKAGKFEAPSEEKYEELQKRLKEETKKSIDSLKVAKRSRASFLKGLQPLLVKAKVEGKISNDDILAILNEYCPHPATFYR